MRIHPIRSFTALASITIIVTASGPTIACSPPSGFSDVTIDDSNSHWAEHGFVRLDPAVHLPSNQPDYDSVEVWLHLPAEGEIETQGRAGELRFPPGTVLDRVSYVGDASHRRVADVRGVRIDDDGRHFFHVYYPESETTSRMLGIEWDRLDANANREAPDLLAERLRSRPPAARLTAAARTAFEAQQRAVNRCGDCHPSSADERSVGERPRPIDSSGFYTPLLSLQDEARLSPHGIYDHNQRDPNVRIACETGSLSSRSSRHGVPRPVCSDGTFPMARFSGEAASRVASICAARSTIYERLDDEGKTLHASSMNLCRIFVDRTRPR